MAAIFNPAAILETLNANRVRFVVIGGIAGGMQGVAWPTQDLDILLDTTDDNRIALVAALTELDACFVMLNPAQVIRPTFERVRAFTGTMLLQTRHGRLDVLLSSGDDTYETVVVDADDFDSTKVCSLAALARMKRQAGRQKDHAVLAKIEAKLSGSS